jgi:hypothetical protein
MTVINLSVTLSFPPPSIAKILVALLLHYSYRFFPGHVAPFQLLLPHSRHAVVPMDQTKVVWPG